MKKWKWREEFYKRGKLPGGFVKGEKKEVILREEKMRISIHWLSMFLFKLTLIA